MKKTIKLAVSAAMLLSATSAFATNGSNLIGYGAKSRAMGGTGIAIGQGADSGLANPAMINSVENMEVMGAATVFMPSVEFGSNAASQANPASQGQAPILMEKSASDMSVIPEVAFAHRLNDNLVYGFAITGTGGMGVDYSDTAFMQPTDNGSFQMKTALQLMKVSIPLAYETNGLTVGLSPVMQYGTLQMSHQINTDRNDPTAFALLESPTASDIGYGYEVGAAYTTNGLTLGAVYKSKISMNYDDTIGKSLVAFGVNGAITSGDALDQPAEFGVGVAYEVSGSTIAIDYKNIAWGDAAGYRDFGWEDQRVFAVGYEYAQKDAWAVRVGYNHAENPVKEQNGAKGAFNPATGAENYVGAIKNFFNTAGFPGVVESHYTAGAGFSVTEALSLDLAVIYAPEVALSYDTTAMTQAFSAQGAAAQGAAQAAQQPGATPQTIQAAAGAAAQQGGDAAANSTADVVHSQLGVTLAVSYKF